MKILCLLILAASLCAEVSFDDTLKKASELKAKGDIRGAIEELNWAQQELGKENMTKIASFIPDQVLDYKGDKLENSAALGMATMDRTYKNADTTIKVSMLTSSGSDAGLGGLAAFAGMAAGMGGQVPGMENIRLKGAKGVIDTTNTTPKATISVSNSVTINVEGVTNVTKEKLVAFVEALNLEGLANYMK